MSAHPKFCPRCSIGRIRRKRLPYVMVVEDQLVNIPRFPALVCDVCHAYMFDPVALSRLEASLSARPRPVKTPRARRAAPLATAATDKPLESF